MSERDPTESPSGDEAMTAEDFRQGMTALSEDFRNDPWPQLAAIREQGQGTIYEESAKTLLVTRAEHMDAILRDRTFWMDPRKAARVSPVRHLVEADDSREPSMLFQDDPQHRRLRTLVARDFAPRALEKWRSRIRATAEQLLDKLEGRKQWDVIEDYSGPLPTIVIAMMLGLEEADFEWFKEASDAVAYAFFNPLCSDEDKAQGEHWRARLNECFETAIARQRQQKEVAEDLISGMVNAREGKDQLSDEEIATQCGLLLIAGNITTTDLIGNGVHALLTHREQWKLLCEQPSLSKNAVEELLRFVPPVMGTGRIVPDEREVVGCPMHRGDSLALQLAAANRDPRWVKEPDRLDIQRENPEHHSFGGGQHFCLGAHLARMEAQEALLALTARQPQLYLPDHQDAAPERRNMPGFAGFISLPVRIG